MARSRQEKILSYTLNYGSGGADDAALSVADWWEGFEWITGPVMVFWKGPGIGSLQVWAISEEEGKGVIRHALAHMGADENDGEWRTATVSNPRFGRVSTVRATMVSARNSSSGKPHAVILDNLALANPPTA